MYFWIRHSFIIFIGWYIEYRKRERLKIWTGMINFPFPMRKMFILSRMCAFHAEFQGMELCSVGYLYRYLLFSWPTIQYIGHAWCLINHFDGSLYCFHNRRVPSCNFFCSFRLPFQHPVLHNIRGSANLSSDQSLSRQQLRRRETRAKQTSY